MGSCMSSMSGKDKKMKRTDTNRSGKGNNELHRTTSSYQGSVAEGMRYSDRGGAERDRLTASQLHKSKTLEERIKQAERENRARGH
ncbi:uncharacterized protein PFL1_00828 [Pseudozyma flocculosa PF-1]|uniref:uncharacterized protein n=1 Tax=Pseudozyma flocculosa PF-1 TaxID=1277687 RepID=UPI0004560E7A|nr:uncharacterized protein PFL1_00828 [Pseudozyma flocculosa PF-1]EPQ31493.1 hypothetical protein PFL1_00828 [Pseudozyma flocculosa PF-1]